jgi:DNA-binding transcriptional regulator GbsR (MarR family)
METVRKKLTKAEIEEHKAFREQMQRNIDRTRRLAEKAQAELDAKRDREQQAS